jgi:hypothetical protein
VPEVTKFVEDRLMFPEESVKLPDVVVSVPLATDGATMLVLLKVTLPLESVIVDGETNVVPTATGVVNEMLEDELEMVEPLTVRPPRPPDAVYTCHVCASVSTIAAELLVQRKPLLSLV